MARRRADEAGGVATGRGGEGRGGEGEEGDERARTSERLGGRCRGPWRRVVYWGNWTGARARGE
jgi:hypothetical protein